MIEVFRKIPEELDAFDGDVVVSIVGQDEMPLRSSNAWLDWRVYGSMVALISKGVFKAELGERCMLPTYGRLKFDRIIMLGGGNLFDITGVPQTEEGKENWRNIFGHLEELLLSLKAQRVGLSLPRYEQSEQEKQLMALLKERQLPKSTSLFVSRMSDAHLPAAFHS